MQLTLGDGVKHWAFLDPDVVHGRGAVFPRLAFQFKARTSREQMRVQIHFLRGELWHGDERLGEGSMTGVELAASEYQLTLEMPVSRAALDYIDRVAVGASIDVALKISGWLLARDSNDDGPDLASAPQPDQWVFESFGERRDARLLFQIARSDWFSKVLEPIGTTEYICTEIALPRADSPLRQAANHLQAAERALREGHDPQVFLNCRGAVESLPNAPKGIFDRLESEQERKRLDGLMLAAGNYFHLGRHTAEDGPRAGEFDVDHADAAFALNLAKLVIAQTARVLARPPRQ
jgi:hypothetical protein